MSHIQIAWINFGGNNSSEWTTLNFNWTIFLKENQISRSFQATKIAPILLNPPECPKSTPLSLPTVKRCPLCSLWDCFKNLELNPKNPKDVKDSITLTSIKHRKKWKKWLNSHHEMWASPKSTCLSLQWPFSYSITSTYSSIRNMSAREGPWYQDVNKHIDPHKIGSWACFPATSACSSERSLPQLRHFLSLFCRAGISYSRRLESNLHPTIGAMLSFLHKRFPNLIQRGQTIIL